MIPQKKILEGYLLLPLNRDIAYRGVDRQPFEPAILPDEMNIRDGFSKNTSRIWELYPTGWRREAYRLYEENSVSVDDLYLLSEYEASRKIQEIITPHLGLYEIVKCRIGDSYILQSEASSEEGFLGYDAAYAGGDYFSAVLNGLIVNPHPLLTDEFGHYLNNFGLFTEIKIVSPYLQRFKELVISESKSKFSIFQLTLTGI